MNTIAETPIPVLSLLDELHAPEASAMVLASAMAVSGATWRFMATEG
jgi:hypothetical protein